MQPQDIKLSIIGLGYVGLPLAVEFGLKHPVLRFDINRRRIDALKSGNDVTPQSLANMKRGFKLGFRDYRIV